MTKPDAVRDDAAGWRRDSPPSDDADAARIERVGGRRASIQTWCASDGRLFRFELDDVAPPRFAVREASIGGVYATVDRVDRGWAVRLTPTGRRSRYAEAVLEAVRDALDELANRRAPTRR